MSLLWLIEDYAVSHHARNCKSLRLLLEHETTCTPSLNPPTSCVQSVFSCLQSCKIKSRTDSLGSRLTQLCLVSRCVNQFCTVLMQASLSLDAHTVIPGSGYYECQTIEGNNCTDGATHKSSFLPPSPTR